MYDLEKRAGRIVRELERLIHPEPQPIAFIEMRRGAFERGANPAEIADGWEPYEYGAPWTMPGSDETVLFRAQAVLPEGLAGKAVSLLCDTNKDGWNALKPQFLLWVDGRAVQAFDTNHRMARLTGRAGVGEAHTLHLAAFGGLLVPGRETDTEPVRLFLDIAAFDEDVWGLYHDIRVPLVHSAMLPGDSAEWSLVVEALNDACNALDLREPGSEAFRASVRAARKSLRKGLYSRPGFVIPATVSCVGQTHIDVAWLWRYCHTREKTARSMATVLALMDEYPDFLFTMSQPQLFQFLKEDYPDIYERVKRRVAEGRLEVEGGMWVESDTNLPSGESLVRQFLHGKRFMMGEFGVDSKILWLPDVFGYSAALPQILRKCGVDYFMTSKLKNNELNKMPDNTFLWRGIDGTGVLTQLTSYNPNFYNGEAQHCQMLPSWREYRNKNLTDDILYTYGYGDGGGGPTREMVETVARFGRGLPGATKARFSRALDFFRKLERTAGRHKRLPVWRGELYYEFHRGTYSSMGKNKRNNRKAEFLLTSAEWAATLDARLLGGAYPAGALDACWKTVLLNQFHDVLPGSSIKGVYEDTDALYAEVFQRGGAALEEACRRIASAVDAPAGSLVAFNPLGWARDAAVYFEAGGDSAALSSGGSIYSAQRCADGRFVSVVPLPPKGWRAFAIVQGAKAPAVKAAAKAMENAFVRVTVGSDGTIGLYDKRAGREAFRGGRAGNRILAFEDKPHGEDNWNLDAYYTEKAWDVPAQSVELVERGPVRAVVRVTRRFLRSEIVQDVILWAHSPRLDFETVIDWRDRDICLKAEFPADVNADRATYEIQFGHLVRNTHQNTSWDRAKFEVCAHKWADLSDGGFGLSLLNDCKYGHDTLDGNLRLTLLRSTCYPNPDADKETHRMTYSVLPHGGDWRQAGTVRQAYDVNVPALSAICGGEGGLPPAFAFAEVSDENVVLETVKQAEDGRGTILRFYDAWNRGGTCTVKLHRALGSAEECNLIEEPAGPADWEGDTLRFAYRPFEIKTFRIQ